MPRGNKLKDELKYEIAGITLLALAILIFISIINPSVGMVGKLVNNSLMRLAGEGRYLLPVLLAFFGCKMLYRKSKARMPVNIYGAMIVTVVALTLLHFSIPGDYVLKAGLQGDGGGIIGGVTYFLLLKSFGIWGVYIILAALLLVGLLLLTNQSIVVLINYVWHKTAGVLKKTIRLVDDFLFVNSSDGEADEQEDAPVIIDRCNVNDMPGNPVDKDYLAEDGEEDAAGEPVATLQKERKSNIIYYRPFRQAADGEAEAYAEEKYEETPANRAELKKSPPATGKKVYKLPSISLLAKPVRGKINKNNRDITENIKRLEETLVSFGIKAKVTQVSRGPAITRYEIQPPPGVKVSRIVGLADDIALSMAAPDVRIEAPIPGKAVVGIEVPNKEIATVYLRELVETVDFQKSPLHLTIALGKDIAGNPIVDDLARMPHLLIAGATGAGKSVCLNTLIAGFLFKSTPEQVKFLIIDPKMVELTTFNGIPHLVSPVVTDPKKAATSLRWAVKEMEYRYELFARSGTRDIIRYNNLMRRQGNDPLPLLVIIIDELADLMMVAPADVEDAICRLAQMARAAGIHLVVATQRPSVDIITGLIKANIPSRISFAVSSQIDSRTILDMGGAEKLLGQGDMLFCPVGASKPVRVQGAYLSDREVEVLVQFWKQQSEPDYDESIVKEAAQTVDAPDPEDELLALAVKIFLETGHASISLLQRRLHIGYARAARLIDIMENKGYVGGYEGSKPRTVLITPDEYMRQFYSRPDAQAGNDN
ncbi:DNA translocase FtsK [Desulfoscipio geothermicus]|uniref:DNA translocase FtsK n=1 Tax=Desulfoscipio geothermicus DSM 3669 TaxID=1121426 RepID=A0A1I6D8P3_9FIRM|nr:DNA translocase FtsK [Desulfoscipio geothermicus]SFR01840.1 DNA translocase FtsK [Desulfoscipio geothermicus DSM 3669]